MDLVVRLAAIGRTSLVKRSPPGVVACKISEIRPCCRSSGDSVATEPTVVSAIQNSLHASPTQSRRRLDPFLPQPYADALAHDVEQDFDSPLIIQAI
jgi:hypothetical protein